VPLDLKDYAGIDRLAAALQQRYGRLDILIGNAGILGPLSPLDHVPAAEWDDVMAVNVTANWRLIKAFANLLKTSDAGRAVFITSGIVHHARAYWGPYTVAKAALDAMARVFAAENATTNVRVNLIGAGPIRTRMLATAMPTADLSNVDKPDKVAKAVVALSLPSVTESGQYYDLSAGIFLAFQPPG
jgi:NAD(P)-dependent dehydrogenase (short-subunit alcohol dehydrogenase family)